MTELQVTFDYRPGGVLPDLDARLADDVELPCETNIGRWFTRRCGQTAEYAARNRGDCGCTEHVLICQTCRDWYENDGIVCDNHRRSTARLTWIERIRSSR